VNRADENRHDSGPQLWHTTCLGGDAVAAVPRRVLPGRRRVWLLCIDRMRERRLGVLVERTAWWTRRPSAATLHRPRGAHRHGGDRFTGPLSSGPRSGAQRIRPANVFDVEDQTIKETEIRGTEGTWKREH
jgi:hypothetical protein